MAGSNKKAASEKKRIAKRKETVAQRQARQKKKVIKEIEKCGTKEGGAVRAGIGPRTLYRWIDEDPEFGQEVEEAITASYGELRATMMDRAKKDSDTLAIFLAKGKWPEEFREQLELKIRNDPGVKLLLQSVVQVFREFIPKDKLKDAVTRFASLTGYKRTTESGTPENSGPTGSLAPPADS